MAKRVGKLAKRYARALLGSLRKDAGAAFGQESAEVLAGLRQFADAWRQNEQLRNSLLSPGFRREERQSALKLVATQLGVGSVGGRFLLTIFERDRLSFVSEIVEAFGEFVDEALGKIPVTVVTAAALSPEEGQEIERTVKQRLSGEPVFNWVVDSGLLGGMVIKYQGKVLDGSLSGQLLRMERALLG